MLLGAVMAVTPHRLQVLVALEGVLVGVQLVLQLPEHQEYQVRVMPVVVD
jgi:hypothetical protein